MYLHEIDNELKKLTFDFFYKFSRFEYSLKANNFGKPVGKHKKATADWPKFRSEYEKNFILSVVASDLLQNPPKMQIFEDGDIIFVTEKHEENDSDLRKVIRSVQRIRNNLFHGGKDGCGQEGDVARNKYLLTTGCKVLDQLAELNDAVAFDYSGGY